jgi:uncharacterized protein involved in exopolysaccharide biosynthesis
MTGAVEDKGGQVRPVESDSNNVESGNSLLLLAVAKWRLLVVCVVAGIAAAVLISILIPPRYVARAAILPRQGPTTLSLLQGFTNLGLPGAGDGEMLESLYGRIVESDGVLESLIATQWRQPGSTEARDIFDLLHSPRGESTPAGAEAIAELKKRLRQKVIAFDRDKMTGYMEVTVTVPRHAWLAAALADSVTARLNSFMQDYRAGKAVEQAEFVSARVGETEAALRVADAELARFVTENRLYTQSMALSQEHRRLSREVEALSSVWIELRRQLELARIESNDRKQSLDILDTARIPVESAWPRRSLSIAAGTALGLVIWVSWIFASLAARRVDLAIRRANLN